MKPLITMLSNDVFAFSTIALACHTYPPSTDRTPSAWFVDAAAKAGIAFCC
jgi:hypothetical protein